MSEPVGFWGMIIRMFNNLRAWIVSIGDIIYAPVTIQHQVIVVMAQEIEKIDDKVLKERIRAAASAAGVEGYLHGVVKREIEDETTDEKEV